MVKHHPELLEQFSAIGNLRSTFGINIMLYNLALNPHINHVVLWGPDKLSNTPIGIAGRQMLLELWNKKTRIDTIVPEIDQPTLDTLLEKVTVTDLSHEPKPDFSSIPVKEVKPYMKPVAFPEFKVEAPDTMPRSVISIQFANKKEPMPTLLCYILFGSTARKPRLTKTAKR